MSDVIVNVTDPPSLTVDLSAEIFNIGLFTIGRSPVPLAVGTAWVTMNAAVFSRPTE
ncbi:unannotated protein [freshwater metagenome]|uniref:Unannotated protein n=1 Tax=freshwater metagenome TaxID=449393 RepID=A0A6J7ETX0_9ZZZZ